MFFIKVFWSGSRKLDLLFAGLLWLNLIFAEISCLPRWFYEDVLRTWEIQYKNHPGLKNAFISKLFYRQNQKKIDVRNYQTVKYIRFYQFGYLILRDHLIDKVGGTPDFDDTIVLWGPRLHQPNVEFKTACQKADVDDCIVLYWRGGHCCRMHCDLFKIYCAPPNLGSYY